MKIFEGIAASEGYALGKLFLNLKRDAMTVPEKARDPQWEISRFLQARERAASEISSIYHRALVQVGSIIPISLKFIWPFCRIRIYF